MYSIQMTTQTITLYKIILGLLIIIAISLFCLNQLVLLSSRQQLLMTPCELCESLKPIIDWSNITLVP